VSEQFLNLIEKKYHTVGTVPKYKRQIAEAGLS